MNRKTRWRESSNGPDWMDLEVAMRSIGLLSGGVVSLTILPEGTGATGGLKIVACWVPSLAEVDGEDQLVLAESTWPCAEGCTLEGHVLGGLYGLDAKLAMMEKNGTKPK